MSDLIIVLNKRIEELEAEVAKLIADRDADRKWEYGYSQQTVDALIAEFNEMRAENERLMELVDGAKEIVEIANCTSPAQCKWKVKWMQKASKPRRRQAMNDINKRLCELLGKPHRKIVDWEFFSPAGRIDLLKRMHIKGCLYEFLARYNFAADFSRDLLNDDGELARAALEFLEGRERENRG
jgi:hypothetical protein